ncbi:unnamed protein product [Durusdinium trenchii]|uniref:Uncharacterized protein n=2 Tax=Durusdinium trenchii TaxID=1381693 RepID=A0ABP0Q7R1_9DINO
MFAKFRSMFRLLVIVTWLRSSVTPVSAAPTLLSCIYGWAECLGLQDSDGFEEAQELGCPTTVDGRYAARTETQLMNQFFSAFRMNSGQSIAGSTIMPYGDGMPCTFNPADDVPAKEQITSLEDIQVTFPNGSRAVVTGATWLPAVEGNEWMTLLLLGNFGFKEGVNPASVVIANSNAYTGQGLQYADTGLDLVYAELHDITSFDAADGQPTLPPLLMQNPQVQASMALLANDTCSVHYPSTTHVVQVVMNGGVTVTWRNNSDLPDHLHHKPGHKGLWQLRIGPNGRVLNEEEYVGMGDIWDPDNIVDLCLKLNSTTLLEMVSKGLYVRVFSTRSCYYLVPPKGDCLSPLVTANCGDSATLPQETCVMGTGPSCTVDAAQSYMRTFTPTQEELDSLICDFDAEPLIVPILPEQPSSTSFAPSSTVQTSATSATSLYRGVFMTFLVTSLSQA